MGTRDKTSQVQRIGRKIRKLRKERRLTQTELSGRVGIHQSDLSRIEKGQYRVSLDTLFRILAEFDIGIGEFFEEPAGSLSDRDAKLIRGYRALDQAARREVEHFIEFKKRQDGPARVRSGNS